MSYIFCTSFRTAIGRCDRLLSRTRSEFFVSGHKDGAKVQHSEWYPSSVLLVLTVLMMIACMLEALRPRETRFAI